MTAKISLPRIIEDLADNPDNICVLDGPECQGIYWVEYPAPDSMHMLMVMVIVPEDSDPLVYAAPFSDQKFTKAWSGTLETFKKAFKGAAWSSPVFPVDHRAHEVPRC